MKKISIVTSCFNEEANIDELYERVNKQMQKFSDIYEWEFILLDNGSVDNTAEKLRILADKDKEHVKVIINSRNFGCIRSPYWAMLSATGDCVIYTASDLQDPPEIIPDFIKKWEEGFLIALGQKNSSEESLIFFTLRRIYYYLLVHLADDGPHLMKNCTGFGLYDRKIIEYIKEYEDPYPFIRGLICDIGFEKALIPFKQPTRKRGISSHNFYSLYDNAMLGLVKHTKFPLRLIAFFGFIISAFCIITSIIYLVLKLTNWYSFNMGSAPLVIGMFFLGGIQLVFLGIIAEYLGAVYTRVNKKPIVIEKERINF